jgi:hypothetical protein
MIVDANLLHPPTCRGESAVTGRCLGLAALAIDHGVAVASADSDFARFPEVRWEDPLR